MREMQVIGFPDVYVRYELKTGHFTASYSHHSSALLMPWAGPETTAKALTWDVR